MRDGSWAFAKFPLSFEIKDKPFIYNTNSISCCHNLRADLSPAVVKGTVLQPGHESREVPSEKHIMAEQARHWHALKITNSWQALPQSYISTPNLAGFLACA